MKISTNRTTWTATGIAYALIAGAPALADDTELLLVNPNPANQPKPNVMFILDTSGSMGTDENTIQPYDSTQTYTGSCDNTKLYWTDIDVTPACDAANTKIIDKTAYKCDFSMLQIGGIGSYTDTMVQYRAGTSGATNVLGLQIWQQLEPGDSTSFVECQADHGVHGQFAGGPVYPASAAGLTDPWTNDENLAISWGSAPRNLAYTVYDGNYLNWKNNPTTVTMTRSLIMKEVTKKVLSSVNNMNVGLMRFNDTEGGPVIEAIQDLDANRQDILNAIDALPADGFTPLSETLYENALYWRGMAAHYGEQVNETPTDPAALASSGPEIYQQPALNVCAKNYNVLLTDGQPTQDLGAESLAPTLPNFATALGRSTCTVTNEGDCLDDISEYLAVEDIDSNTSGMQIVTTHTIGFTVDLPILKSTAEISGGEYFLANDVESLTLSLLSILANINDRSLSFSAPAVSVNTFNRTQNLNDLYLTMFGAKARAHWPGNLKRYKITNRQIVDANGLSAVDPASGFFYDTALSFWTTGGADGNDVRMGGAAQQLPDPTVRNLYTNNSGSDLTVGANLITPSNAGSFADSDFGLTGASGEPTKDQIIRWMRGEDVRDEDGNAATTVRRVMGDPLHSQPAAIVYGGSQANPDIVVYVATNDGYLHAIDGNTGQELWSFVPKELLPNMTRLYFDPASNYKQYGLDGDVVPVVKDANKNGIVDGSDFVYLIVGMRRGGSTYYALDVTNKNAPQLKWNTSLTSAGQSWSTPVVARMDITGGGLNADNAVIVIGGGYDPVHDTSAHPNSPDAAGAGIHILDLESGAELWRAGSDGAADLQIPEMTRAIATEVRVVDFSGDGFADRMYASDMGGQVFRIDLSNGNGPASFAAGGVIARVGAEGLASPGAADTRRFYTSPDVSIFMDNVQDKRFVAVSLGSGYRAHPFDLTATDRFFSFRDPDVFNKLTQTEYDNYGVITDANLVEVSGQKQVVINNTDGGWKFTLPANQKVLSDSVTFNNEVFFVGFSPMSNAAATCTAGNGTNFLYRVSVVNGDPIVNNLDALSPADADDARRETLQQGGIAPAPAVLFPSPDDPNCSGAACAPPPIACVGVECFDPGFANNPVRTLWTQDGIQ